MRISVAEKLKRINILVKPEQVEQVARAGLKMSGLVRDMLDDYFSEYKVVLSLSPKAKRLYDNVVSNFGVEDKDLEPYFIQALDKFLEQKTREIDALRKGIGKKSSGR